MQSSLYGTPTFEPGDLVSFEEGDGEKELFIVIENMYDKDVMSTRLCIIDSTGRISKYPIWWFKIVQRFHELQQ